MQSLRSLFLAVLLCFVGVGGALASTGSGNQGAVTFSSSACSSFTAALTTARNALGVDGYYYSGCSIDPLVVGPLTVNLLAPDASLYRVVDVSVSQLDAATTSVQPDVTFKLGFVALVLCFGLGVIAGQQR